MRTGNTGTEERADGLIGRASHSGARWVRAALQVNPYGYKGPVSPDQGFSSEEQYNSALLDKCEAEGIELIAVTDHWSVESALGLIAASADRDIAVLPGFEANTSEGIHLLVIFEAGTETTEVNAAIGACGATPGCDNGSLGHPYDKIMRDMTAHGALVIPAHANVDSSGMLANRTGNPLVNMIKHSDLHAIGISPSVAPTKDQALIFGGTKPFDRPHSVAEIFADDICHPDKLAEPGSTTWFKASEPCLASLKHAVRIPVTRVSTNNPELNPQVLFTRLSWVGGFLGGVEIYFSGDLTAMIGGRGTGKSTVIESIRYVLGLDPIGDAAKRDHLAVIERVLGSGTVIKLEVQAISPSQGRFTIQRAVHDPPVVLDAAGTRTNLKPNDIVGEIEIFGQHELAEVAQDKSHVAQMIERIAGEAKDEDALSKVKRELRNNRNKLEQLEEEERRLADELADLPRLQEAVDHFRTSGWVAQLNEKERLDKDSAVFVEGSRRVENAKADLGSLRLRDIASRLGSGFEDIDSSPQKEELRKVVEALSTAAETITAAASQIDDTLDFANRSVESAQVAWTTATQAQVDEHAELLRKLKHAGHDPDGYLTFTKRLGELRVKVPELTGIRQQLADLKIARTQLLGRLDDIETAEKRRLNDAIRRSNAATGGAVIVKPTASSERSHMKDVINTRVSKQRSRLIEAVEADNFSARAFVAAAREGKQRLEEKYDIKGAQADAIFEAGERFLRQFEELAVPSAVDVLLDIGTDGKHEYRTLDDLSKGQKATALLLLLLSAAETPLIIDQPEDDLDNRFVYDQVVDRIRKLKGSRQIIVSTHNANVPVLGDAELIVTLESDGTKGWLKEGCTGSLDRTAVKDIAEQILEGGRAAFDARRHLYGID
jgi:DNA repair ATPase RecN